MSYRSKYKYHYGDGKAELEPKDDAATVNWGEEWEMPTHAQFEELINPNYTTFLMTTQNDVKGMLITSKINNNSIFLPAAGRKGVGEIVYEEVNTVHYWSRSVMTDNGHAHEAYALVSYKKIINQQIHELFWTYECYRYYGFSVRPVRKQ